jgi:hypothetical protein
MKVNSSIKFVLTNMNGLKKKNSQHSNQYRLTKLYFALSKTLHKRAMTSKSESADKSASGWKIPKWRPNLKKS